MRSAKEFQTDRSIKNQLSTINQYGETIIAKLNNYGDVEFFHHDYDPEMPLVLASFEDSIYCVFNSGVGTVIVNRDEFRWMLNAEYELKVVK